MGWTAQLPAGLRHLTPWLIHAAARFTRPMTLGVRAVILRDGPQGPQVFLVRHSYVAGWHLPGGAVEAGETLGEALVREIREECAIALDGPPALFGLYFNRRASRRDHVALYVVQHSRLLTKRKPDWEILEARFFDRSALPEGVTGAVRLRLAEVLDGETPSADWN